jgi:hypothetical protein
VGIGYCRWVCLVFALCFTEKIWVKEGKYLQKEKEKKGKEIWGKKEIRISYLRLMHMLEA